MVLSPQLQQSLALLQAPVLELKAMVEQEMQQNPMLEEAPTLVSDPGEHDEEDSAAVMADPAEPPADTRFDPATEAPSSEPVDRFDQDLQKVLQLDQEWRDFFSSTSTPATPARRTPRIGHLTRRRRRSHRPQPPPAPHRREEPLRP